MPRESTISIDELTNVANKILANGCKPHARNVREALGRGSMATILKLLKQWQGGQLNNRNVAEDALDPSVTYSINNYIMTKVEVFTSDSKLRMAEMQSDTDMLIAEYERLTEDLTSQTNALILLQQQHDEMSGRVKELKAEAIRTAVILLKEQQTIESARIALVKAELRLEALPRMEAELDKVRAELVDARTQSALFSEAAAVAKAKYEAELGHRGRS